MPDQELASTAVATKALLASGFPFQTAVAGIIRATPNWTLAHEEFSWRDAGGEDRFLDIVARWHRFVVAIECKKTQKDLFTFLQPGGINGDVIRARCLYLTQIHDSTQRMELFTGEWTVSPKSAESMFCVVSTSASGKDQRLLKRDAGMLVRATDAYARQFKADYAKKGNSKQDHTILPVIVTNAELFVAEYKTSDISLESGQLPEPLPSPLQPVPWVRFRKAFGGSKDLGDRTVFVVRAVELSKWLQKLDFAGVDAASETGRAHFK